MSSFQFDPNIHAKRVTLADVNAARQDAAFREMNRAFELNLEALMALAGKNRGAARKAGRLALIHMQAGLEALWPKAASEPPKERSYED